jgi:hypothetical protein
MRRGNPIMFLLDKTSWRVNSPAVKIHINIIAYAAIVLKPPADYPIA